MAVCKDCEHYKVCLVHCSESVLRNRGICEHFKNGWISVKDRLPEDGIDQSKDIKNIKVLVAIKAKNGWTVRTQTRCKSTCGGRYGEPLKVTWYWRHFSAGEVTHWMPLPEPPKEE